MKWLVYGAMFCVILISGIACDKQNDNNDPTWDFGPMPDADSGTPVDPAVVSHENLNGEQTWSNVVPTGQKKCYNNQKEIPCPQPGDPFFGQDAQNGQWKTRSFLPGTGGDAGTVVDDVTGLRWQQGFALNLAWDGAYAYCENLDLAGREWRLPTTHELKSIIDYGMHAPAIDLTAFPGTPESVWFWGTSRVKDIKNTAWIVYSLDGFVEYTDKNNRYAVRCVENI
ncbi:MAG TPA: DUF1566 domain-containing protein [bacterium]|nr:DUF1566 domain-containing protein [bacterium]